MKLRNEYNKPAIVVCRLLLHHLQDLFTCIGTILRLAKDRYHLQQTATLSLH